MPFVNIRTSAPLDAAGIQAVTDAAHKAINVVLSKPDQYIAVDVTVSPNLQFGGTKAPAAMISVHSIGYGEDAKGNKEALLKALGEAMKAVGNVPGDRLFVSFEDVHKDNWGFDGQLFSTIFGRLCLFVGRGRRGGKGGLMVVLYVESGKASILVERTDMVVQFLDSSSAHSTHYIHTHPLNRLS